MNFYDVDGEGLTRMFSMRGRGSEERLAEKEEKRPHLQIASNVF